MPKAIPLSRLDPTRTGAQRRMFAAKLRRQFAQLKGKVYKYVVTDDALGLGRRGVVKLADNAAAALVPVRSFPAVQLWKQVQARLDPRDVVKLEDSPHITARYGFLGLPSDAASVGAALRAVGPLELAFGGLSVFSNSDADVLKVDVEGEALRRLNQALADIPNIETYSSYQPHMTVAYLRPGTGQKYVGPSGLEGLTWRTSRVTYSDDSRSELELAANAFCPTGPGGGVDATCSPSGPTAAQQSGALARVKGGIATVRAISAKLRKKLTDRYGAKTALAIVVAAQATSWSSAAGAVAVGLPGAWIPSPVAALPFVALAELKHQLTGGKAHNEGGDEPVTQEQTAQLLQDIWEELRPHVDLAENADVQFASSSEQLAEFERWLDQQFSVTIAGKSQQDLWARYIQDGFKRGAGRAYDDARKGDTAAVKPDSREADLLAGGKQEFMRLTLGAPEAVDKVKLLASRTFSEMDGISSQMATRMGRVLADGLVRGANPRDVADDLDDELDIGLARAETVARTEFIRAHAEGQLNSMEELGLTDTGVMVEWSTAGDDRVCPECDSMEGKLFTLEDAHGLIPAHPNCVLGSSRVVCDDAYVMLEAHYTGEVVEVSTVSGRAVTVTANHVLLTEHGFIPARYLDDTMHLVDARTVEGGPQDHCSIPCISDVFASLTERRGMLSERVEVATEDVHSEGAACDFEVYVVRPDSELGVQLEHGAANELSLVAAHPVRFPGAHAAGSSSAQLLARVASAFDGSMGVRRDALALANAHRLPAHRHRLTVAAFGDASFAQHPVDPAPTAFVPHGQVDYGGAGDVRPHDRIARQERPAARVHESSGALAREPVFSSELSDRGAFSDTASNSFDCEHSATSSGVIWAELGIRPIFDAIVSVVRRRVTAEPVYDVSAKSTMYVLDGVLSSNCRCAFIPAGVGEAPTTDNRAKLTVNWQYSWNAFCPTGPGGGVDPTCAPHMGADTGQPSGGGKGVSADDFGLAGKAALADMKPGQFIAPSDLAKYTDPGNPLSGASFMAGGAMFKDFQKEGVLDANGQVQDHPLVGSKVPAPQQQKPVVGELQAKMAKAGVGFTAMHKDKLAVLNPNGVEGGVFKIDCYTSDKAKNEAKLEWFKQNLPPGTVIKHVSITKKDIAAAATSAQQVQTGGKMGTVDAPAAPAAPSPLPSTYGGLKAGHEYVNSLGVKKVVASVEDAGDKVKVKFAGEPGEALIDKQTPFNGKPANAPPTPAPKQYTPTASEPEYVPAFEEKSYAKFGAAATKAASTDHKAYSQSLKGAQLEAIESYTSSGYGALNAKMRSCPPDFGCLGSAHAKMKDDIEKAIAAAPPFSKPVQVRRGMDLSASALHKFADAMTAAKDGDVDFQFPSFASTSTNSPFGGNVKFNILAKRGLYVDHISSIPGEREVIVSPKQKFAVRAVTKKGSDYIVDLEEK